MNAEEPGAWQRQPAGEPSVEVLHRAVDLLIRQVGHWTAPRWGARVGDLTRADLMHQLVQRIADLAADAEGEPQRAVPRLDNDLALPDQLRVTAADLVAVDPPTAILAHAAAEVRTVREALT